MARRATACYSEKRLLRIHAGAAMAERKQCQSEREEGESSWFRGAIRVVDLNEVELILLPAVVVSYEGEREWARKVEREGRLEVC